MTGKEKCELLKSLRQSIADLNGISYSPTPCNHRGDCPGFCPACDAEAAYIMRELKKREAAGLTVRIDTETLSQFESLSLAPTNDLSNEEVLDGLMPEPLSGITAAPDIEDGRTDEDTVVRLGEYVPEPLDGQMPPLRFDSELLCGDVPSLSDDEEPLNGMVTHEKEDFNEDAAEQADDTDDAGK